MCTAGSGNTKIFVSGTLHEAQSASSYCRHVAVAVADIRSACQFDASWQDTGTQFSYGNGHFFVGVNW
jgi:hypothetical protein